MSITQSTTHDFKDSLSLFKHAYEQVVMGAELEFNYHPAVRLQRKMEELYSGAIIASNEVVYREKIRDQKIERARMWLDEKINALYGH